MKINQNNILRLYQEGKEWEAALKYVRTKSGILGGLGQLARTALSSLGPYLGSQPIVGPLYAGWDLSYGCNAKCGHCGRHKDTSTDANRLTFDEIARVSGELRDAGTQHICLAGGEPLLLDELADIIRYMKNLRLSVSICTNGALLAEKANTLVSAGLDNIIVSVDGRPESHDRMRGVKGLFRMAESGIAAIIQQRRDNRPTISCRMLVHEDNVQEIPFFVARWDKAVDSILLQPLHRGTHNLYELTNGLQIVKSTERLRAVLKETGLDRNLYNSLMPDYLADSRRFRHLPCLAGHWVVRISPTGDVYPCVEQLDHVGNLRQQSFKEIWRGARFNCTRKSLSRQKECHCYYNDMFMNLYMWKAHEHLPILRHMLHSRSWRQPVMRDRMVTEGM